MLRSSPFGEKLRMSLRYRNVKPVINTGFNARFVKEELRALNKEFRIKPNECFKRIGINALALLLLEVAELEALGLESKGDPHFEEPVGGDYRTNDAETINPTESGDSKVFCRKTTSIPRMFNDSKSKEIPSVASLMRGMDGPDTGRGGSQSGVDSTWHRPYLLLDVRDPDLFCKESICTAKNYPASRLSRVNWEAPFLRHYKNRANRLIVLLDDDEILAAKAATVLVERGYDNVYLLSGGLNLARKRFKFGGLVVKVPEGFLPYNEDQEGHVGPLWEEFGSLRARPESVVGRNISQSDGKLTDPSHD
ncbi:unnamed protein product [Notodromas monacha]|uniref:Rhodanese domain-containing protein n=1 Tax=Notodromas monacha TaxID=399045 RepID=A0A7R9G8F9_9CRUS|nr:unnamed protein product [Notodromas monacha]CAG0913120.1 unnamed protein product [Notodromas monacha]